MFDLEYIAKQRDGEREVKQILLNTLCLPNALIKRLKAQPNGILVNGIPKTVRAILNEGDILRLHTDEAPSNTIVPTQMPLDIIFEDDYLLAINKPINMPSHPSHGHINDTLANGVVAYYNTIGLSAGIHIVTRLDRNTSGVVLFAKDAYVHDLMSRLLRTGALHKEYLALCEGEFDDAGIIDAPIARTDNSIITRCVSQAGAKAITKYKTICHSEGKTIVCLTPHTGRTHQLRVHMSHIGHPIVGDDLYGAKPIDGAHHCLHAYRLSFVHPITNKLIEIKANNNNDWGDFDGTY